MKWPKRETLKVLSTPEMKEKLLKAGFLVRPKGGAEAWARATKEIDLYKSVIDQAGIPELQRAAPTRSATLDCAGPTIAGGWNLRR